jgi:hypothetical protein
MGDVPSYTTLKTAELLARAKRLLKESGKIELEIQALRAAIAPRPIPGSKQRRVAP